jgi:hypothetical protein
MVSSGDILSRAGGECSGRLDAFSSTQHTEVAPQLPPLSLSLAFTDAIKAYYNSASG